MQCVAVCCSVLQCVAVCCSKGPRRREWGVTFQRKAVQLQQNSSKIPKKDLKKRPTYTKRDLLGVWVTFAREAVHLLQKKSSKMAVVSFLEGLGEYTATHCNTLQHTATHCNTLQHTATQSETL